MHRSTLSFGAACDFSASLSIKWTEPKWDRVSNNKEEREREMSEKEKVGRKETKKSHQPLRWHLPLCRHARVGSRDIWKRKCQLFSFTKPRLSPSSDAFIQHYFFDSIHVISRFSPVSGNHGVLFCDGFFNTNSDSLIKTLWNKNKQKEREKTNNFSFQRN